MCLTLVQLFLTPRNVHSTSANARHPGDTVSTPCSPNRSRELPLPHRDGTKSRHQIACFTPAFRAPTIADQTHVEGAHLPHSRKGAVRFARQSLHIKLIPVRRLSLSHHMLAAPCRCFCASRKAKSWPQSTYAFSRKSQRNRKNRLSPQAAWIILTTEVHDLFCGHLLPWSRRDILPSPTNFPVLFTQVIL